MTGPPVTVAEPEPMRRAGQGIGRAAVLIGGITVLARLVGFARQLVFAHTVGSTCLGTAYATANQVPNIVYDIVLGGALTTAVVPVLAVVASRRAASPAGADEEVSQITSALLTWTVLLLAPMSVAVAAMSGPLTSLLLAGAPGCRPPAASVSVSSGMLVVFAPQILLYGLAVVLYGVLQADRRFAAPALAPVLSSLVVIAAYIAFVPLGQRYRNHLAHLPLPAQLVLSVGTTVGVAALGLTALGPVLRLRLRLRPRLRFPPGVAKRVRGIAAVGVATLIAQNAALLVVIVLANAHQGRGGLVLYNYGWQVFFVPYAVLAVPIATSAFPALSADGGPGFDQTSAASTRAVMLVSWLGAALLAGAAVPASRLFALHPPGAHRLALIFAAFAPGLVGYGLSANLSRVLFACQRSRVAAVALVTGWLVVIAADLAIVPAVRQRWVIPVLGLGNTIGLTVAGLALLVAVRGVRGAAALRGTGRAAAAGLAGALTGAFAGAGLSAAISVRGALPNAAVTMLACAVVTVAFGAVVVLLDGRDLRALAGRARAWLTR